MKKYIQVTITEHTGYEMTPIEVPKYIMVDKIISVEYNCIETVNGSIFCKETADEILAKIDSVTD